MNNRIIKYSLTILLSFSLVLMATPIVSHADVESVKVCVGGTIKKTYTTTTSGVTVTAVSDDPSVVVASVTGNSTIINGNGIFFGSDVTFQGVSAGSTTVGLYANGVLSTSIPVTVGDHTWDEGKITKAASCTEEGITTYTCSSCSVTKNEPIPKTPHALSFHGATSATCTNAGSSEHWECLNCKKYFSDSLGVTEIPATSIQIPQIPHSWNSEYTIDVNPTYWVKGEKSIHCTVCHQIQPGSTISIKKLKVGKTSITKIKKNGSNKISLKWKKIPKTTEYEIDYDTKSSFSNSKTAYIKSTSCTLKKLKKKTTYYVRVRSCIQNKNTDEWAIGSWSKTKKIKL